MKKAVVYSATRNMYTEMAVASESLLQNSNIDKVYYLIEDDQFPYILNPKVEVINISNQPYIKKTSPNWNNPWTYIVLLRAAYTKIFTQYDFILSLDVDTIVEQDISELWDLPLNDYYLAAVEEKFQWRYANFGVVLFNLKKIRNDHIDDIAIEQLNTIRFRLNEQDCLNMLCKNNIFYLPYDYNVSEVTLQVGNYQEKIRHFNDSMQLPWRTNDLYIKYRQQIYVQSTKDYLTYIQYLNNAPDKIISLWQELKMKQNYSYDEKDFKLHMNDFLPYKKVGYTFSIKKFINDLQTNQKPSNGYIQI